jgi:uncharacterized protein
MSAMRILHFVDYRRMPWKNGGGETIEIAVSPEGAGLDNFDWRISMAKVESDGPFSQFPGVERTLSVLEGEGIALSIEGMPSISLGKARAPFSFDASLKTDAQLKDGAIVDLNVMSRKGAASHHCYRILQGGNVSLGAKTTVVFSIVDGLIVDDGKQKLTLETYDSAIVQGQSDDANLVISGGDCYVIEIT